jgi:imidazole glycerol-phosphate synthase subunit HisH
MIGLIDFNAGNLYSLQNAFKKINAKTKIVKSKKDLMNCSKLVLPGVGAFGSAMKNLKEKQLDLAVIEWINSGKPFLGICIGMQLLFESSEESSEIKGLNVFKGKIKKFQGLKVPQMGWNQIQIKKNSKLFQGISNNEFVYFANSFYANPKKEIISSVTEYGIEFCSAIEKGNTFAVQFHPEKSGSIGLKILKNFNEVK